MWKMIVGEIFLCSIGVFALLSVAYAIHPPACGYILLFSCLAALGFVAYVVVGVVKSNRLIKKYIQEYDKTKGEQ